MHSTQLTSEHLSKIKKSKSHFTDIPGTILLFFALALVVPIIGLMSIALHGPQIELDTYANLQSIARTKSVQIESWLNERQGNAVSLMESTGFAWQVGQLAQQRSNAVISKPILSYLDTIRTTYGYDSIVLLNASGQSILKSGENTDIPNSMQDQLHMAVIDRSPKRGELYRNKYGDVFLDWAVPVATIDSDGFYHSVGVVVLRSLAQKHLFRIVQDWPIVTQGAEALLIKRHGNSVVFLNELGGRSGTAMTNILSLNAKDMPEATAIRSDRPGTIKGNDYRGVSVLAAYRSIPGTDWHIVTKIDRDNVLMPLRALISWIGWIAFIAIAILSAAIYVAVFSDIAKLKSTEAKLEFLANNDQLTDLPNRRLLFNKMAHSIRIAKRDKKQFALLMLDLDRFKHVNDSFGHLAGDMLLQQVAERLSSRLRKVDTIARLGGDEFTVILEDVVDPDDVARVANDIINDLSKPWQLLNYGEVRISVSIGISLYPLHGDTPETLLQHADIALYLAKENGRSCHAYFSENLALIARERITLEAKLRKAIEQDELKVFYQPQVSISSGAIIGAEALVRWQDPVDGLIPPMSFIPLAEETGLIMAIGEWVLRETCRQGKEWIDAGFPSITLAVNVSPVQFAHSDIITLVADVLKETDYPSELLELEVTESGLMENQDHAIEILTKLRALGVRLAIDDFGTGYSSLTYLKHFPLNVLKIDKGFIDDIPSSQDDMEIAATIVAMARTLGFEVLAEGVETKEQLDFLTLKGCESYQGYLKSRPLPADQFATLLRKEYGMAS